MKEQHHVNILKKKVLTLNCSTHWIYIAQCSTICTLEYNICQAHDATTFILPQPAFTNYCDLLNFLKAKESFAHLFVDLRYQKVKLQIMCRCYMVWGFTRSKNKNYVEMHLKMIISLESMKVFFKGWFQQKRH